MDRVGLLCQFIDGNHVKDGLARSVVVHCLSYMSIAVEDISITVSTRARSVLQSIKITSLKVSHHFSKYLKLYLFCAFLWVCGQMVTVVGFEFLDQSSKSHCVPDRGERPSSTLYHSLESDSKQFPQCEVGIATAKSATAFLVNYRSSTFFPGLPWHHKENISLLHSLF